MQTDSDAVGRHESRERLLNDFPGAAGKPCWTAPRLAEKDDSLVTIYAKPANPQVFSADSKVLSANRWWVLGWVAEALWRNMS